MKNISLTILVILGIILILIFPLAGLEVLLFDNTNVSEEKIETQLPATLLEENEEEFNSNEAEKIDEVSKEIEKVSIDDDIKLPDDYVIVNGKSVKVSFDFHQKRIYSKELVFLVIDAKNNLNYYYDYENLDRDIDDNQNYKKEFELNERGELVKYIYTEM